MGGETERGYGRIGKSRRPTDLEKWRAKAMKKQRKADGKRHKAEEAARRRRDKKDGR